MRSVLLYLLNDTQQDHSRMRCVLVSSVLQPSSIRGLATPWTYFLRLYLCHSYWLFYGESCPHLDVVHGLPRLCAPGIVPCIISLSGQLPCFLMVWPQYASFFALTVFSSAFLTPALTTQSFVFLCCPQNSQYLPQSFHLKGVKMSFFISKCPAFTAIMLLQAILALLLVIFCWNR